MRRWARAAAGLAFVGSTFAAMAPVVAGDAEVKVAYSATLAGLPIGTGSLRYSLDGDDYKAAIEARISGFGKLFTSREAEATSEGRFNGERAMGRSYGLTITGAEMSSFVRMTMANGAVGAVEASDVRLPGWVNRVPLQPQHKRGIIDPLAAFMIKLDAGKDPFARENCGRVQPIFDGRVRYDLRLVYGAVSDVRGPAGSYSGKALICAVNYKPIAGFRQLTEEERKFEESIEFSIWFVPVGETGLMLPHRVLVGTPVGLLIVKADRFQADINEAALVTGSVPPKR